MKKIVLALLGCVLVLQTFQLIRMKVRQHIRVIPLAALAQQGETAGRVSAVVDIKAGPRGTVYTLSHLSKGYFLQRFSPEFVVEAGRLFETKAKPLLNDVVAMSVLADARVLLAERNGRVIRLGADFKPEHEFKLDLVELRAMCPSGDGKLLVLEPLARKIFVFSNEGVSLGDFGGGKLTSPRTLVVTQAGRAVVLDQSGETYYLRVFDATGKFERSLRVSNVSPSPPDTLGAGGHELVALNDAAGVRGVLFFDVESGRFYGETLGAEGSEEPIVHPGFAAGDPQSGNFYLHFGPGLLKCRIPD